MRNLFLLMFVLFAFSSQAQWKKLGGGNKGPEVRGVYFVNGKVGYVSGGTVGTSSTIAKTVDGGASWTVTNGTITGVLRAIHCIDANTCIACGEFGNIVKTTDGGVTWTAKPSGVTTTLRSVDFVNASTGFIGGGLGVILKTKDGGETWAPVASTGTTQDIINLRFANSDIGYAASCTSVFSDGLVLKTTDGGDNWSVVYSNVQGLLGIAVPSEDVVYAAGGNNQGIGGYAVIVKTSDGGLTWDEVFQGAELYYAFRAADFSDEKNGWVVGDGGYVEGTADGGATWNKFTTANAGMLGIHFPNDTGYATGTATFIMKYTKILRSSDEDLAQLMELKVYPNPANDAATILIDSELQGDVQIRIADASGRMVQSMDAGEQRQVTLNISSLPAGMYFVMVEANGLTGRHQKLIVQ